MADTAVASSGAAAQTLQNAVQAKLIENEWAAEENDTTLSEYVTTMLVSGKDAQAVQAELGGELLGIGEDDPTVVEFTQWLFSQVQSLAGQQQQQDGSAAAVSQGDGNDQNGGDADMGDASGVAPTEGAYVSSIPRYWCEAVNVLTRLDRPSGPKAMRSGPGGGRGRGGRMLGQMTRQMDRTGDDSLRRIKGAASGAGRIDSHSGRAPRGPRGQHNNMASGMQRMMNGRGGGAGMGMPPGGAMGQLGQFDSQQQMAFLQMMEMQANMMANMLQTGQMPNMGNGQGGYAGRGGRGGKSLFDRMEKRGGGRPHQQRQQQQDGDVSMDGDASSTTTEKRGTPFDTMCKFNLGCTIPTCPFAHQSPANTRPGVSVDISDTCSHGVACTNNKCTARHPSPASRHSGVAAPYSANGKIDADCKFFPNCTAGPMCPFKHPDVRPCRNGADCSVAGCPFAHSTIACRYNPCTRPDCPFKHAAGQKRGKFEDKVWTADGQSGPNAETNGNGSATTSDRFAGFSSNQGEELIIPGQQSQEEQGSSENGGQSQPAVDMDTVA